MKITIKYSTYKRMNAGVRPITGSYNAADKTITVELRMPDVQYTKALLAPVSELVAMAKEIGNTISENQAEQERESLKAWVAQNIWGCTTKEADEILAAIRVAEQDAKARMEENGKSVTADKDRTIRVDSDTTGFETIITVKAGCSWVDSIVYPLFAQLVTDTSNYDCLYRAR